MQLWFHHRHECRDRSRPWLSFERISGWFFFFFLSVFGWLDTFINQSVSPQLHKCYKYDGHDCHHDWQDLGVSLVCIFCEVRIPFSASEKNPSVLFEMTITQLSVISLSRVIMAGTKAHKRLRNQTTRALKLRNISTSTISFANCFSLANGRILRITVLSQIWLYLTISLEAM